MCACCASSRCFEHGRSGGNLHVCRCTLFAIDAYCRTREKATCTGVKAKVPQGVKGVTPKPAAEMDFSSAKSKKDKLDKVIDDETATAAPSTLKQLPVVDVPDADEQMNDLISQLN